MNFFNNPSGWIKEQICNTFIWVIHGITPYVDSIFLIFVLITFLLYIITKDKKDRTLCVKGIVIYIIMKAAIIGL